MQKSNKYTMFDFENGTCSIKKNMLLSVFLYRVVTRVFRCIVANFVFFVRLAMYQLLTTGKSCFKLDLVVYFLPEVNNRYICTNDELRHQQNINPKEPCSSSP